MSDNKKKKKKKTVYIDDGRTIADMSAFQKPSLFGSQKKDDKPIVRPLTTKKPIETFLSAMKSMFIPMLVTIGIISLAFLLVYLML